MSNFSRPQSPGEADDNFARARSAIVTTTSALIVQTEVAAEAEISFASYVAAELQSLRALSSEVYSLREKIACLEMEYARRRNSVLTRESSIFSQKREKLELYRQLEANLRLVSTNGTEADRAAIEAIFRRAEGRFDTSPYRLPSKVETLRAEALLNEVYIINSSSRPIKIPEYAYVNTPFAFGFSDEDGDEDENTMYLKLARVRKSSNRADIFTFVLTSRALCTRGRAALLEGVVKPYRATELPVFERNLITDLWFVRNATEHCFPASNAEVFEVALQGIDARGYAAMYGSSCGENPQIASRLLDLLKSLQFDANDARRKMPVGPDWNWRWWQSKLPLEYVNGACLHKTGSCVLNCDVLATRVKTSPDRQPVFSMLVYHNGTGQLFWQKFDHTDPQALHNIVVPDGACDVPTCCHIDKPAAARSVSPASHNNFSLTAPSPLKTLSSSMYIDNDTMTFYGALENLAQRSFVDPSDLIREAQRAADDSASVEALLPQIGHSIILRASVLDTNAPLEASRPYVAPQVGEAGNRKRRSDVTERDPCESREPKKKRDTGVDAPAAPVGEILVARMSGGKKRPSCSICGVEGVTKTTHDQMNHGSAQVLPQEALQKWRTALIAEGKSPDEYFQ